MLFLDDLPVRCFACRWRERDFKGMNVTVGSSASQTFFEVLAVVLAIEVWCVDASPTILLGDNVAALQETLDLKGKGPQEPLAQALALLRCSRTLRLTVAHLASEANLLADALSRQSEPGNTKPWPFRAGSAVCVDKPLRPSTLWKLVR